MRKGWSLASLLLFPVLVWGSETSVHLDKAPIDLSDYASMQRGAQIYMNNCSGCHGLRYTRYDAMASGIQITDEEGQVLDDIVKQTLMFSGDKLSDPILSAMPSEDAAEWFGAPPPDLTLVARTRGVDWLYTYMRKFYHDPKKPWGVNNLVFPDVGMPHVLVNWQGVQEPVYEERTRIVDGREVTEQEIKDVKLVKQGQMSPAEYDAAVADLVNFLSYVAEPVQLERKRLGVWVLAFLGILIILTYMLKREFWKKIH